jgi:hypothetical protein
VGETPAKPYHDKSSFHKSHIANYLENSDSYHKHKQPHFAKERLSDKQQLGTERIPYRLNPSPSLLKQRPDRP